MPEAEGPELTKVNLIYFWRPNSRSFAGKFDPRGFSMVGIGSVLQFFSGKQNL
jgi:hypothetical protein